MTERIQQELLLLRSYYHQLEYVDVGHWVLIGNYTLPSDSQWNRDKVDICFQIPAAYPGAPPYGFYVPSDIKCG